VGECCECLAKDPQSQAADTQYSLRKGLNISNYVRKMNKTIEVNQFPSNLVLFLSEALSSAEAKEANTIPIGSAQKLTYQCKARSTTQTIPHSSHTYEVRDFKGTAALPIHLTTTRNNQKG